jgi:hypothetical protein
MTVSRPSLDFQQQQIRLSLLAGNLILPGAIHPGSQVTDLSYFHVTLPPKLAVLNPTNRYTQ